MKKTNKFLVLLATLFFSTSMLLAQADTTKEQSLDDILRRIENRSSSSDNQSTNSGSTSNTGTSEASSTPKEKTKSLGTVSQTASPVEEDYIMGLVHSSLYLVRQEYKVRSNGSEVGKDDLPYWGYGLGIGVQVGEKTLLPQQMYRPWEYDENYAEVKLKYPEAVASKTKLMSVTETEYKTVGESVQWNEGATLSFIDNKNKEDYGLEASDGDTKGDYLLVLISVNDPKSESPAIYQTTKAVSTTWTNDRIILENFNAPNNCIGGVLFQKENNPGQLIMKVAGIGSMAQEDMIIYAATEMKSSRKSSRDRGSRDNDSDKDKKEDKKVDKKDKKKSSRSSRGRRSGRRGN